MTDQEKIGALEEALKKFMGATRRLRREYDGKIQKILAEIKEKKLKDLKAKLEL